MQQGISINLKELENKKHRFCYNEIKAFIDGNKQENGKILVLYGLRRTGKTTLMQQIITEYKDKSEYKNKWRYYKLSIQDTMLDLDKELIKAEKEKANLIFIDEITNAQDFVDNCAFLADIYAGFYGMKIIVAGTNSLGFHLAAYRELYDRAIYVKTTHIPYAEHSQVLNINNIDDYIQYGGLMRPGINENIVKSYDDAVKYLDSAVAFNIALSIKKDPFNNILENLTITDIKIIIEKMVEVYSGSFKQNKIQNKLTTATINYPLLALKKYNHQYKEYLKKYIDSININKNKITKEYLEIINAHSEITTEITQSMIKELIKYLYNMDLLSTIEKVEFNFNERNIWIKENSIYEDYIIQPAIKYFHLERALNFIDTSDYYKNLDNYLIENNLNNNSYNELYNENYKNLYKKFKNIFKKKLEEKIKGDMLEQIINYDVFKALNNILYKNNENKKEKKYLILKPIFTFNDNQKGNREYDLLIYDKEKEYHYDFEIKHTNNSNIEQDKYLIDDLLTNCINSEYGERKIAAVLYNGKHFINENNTPYFNASDFLITINKYKDIEISINHLVKDLMYDKDIFYKGIINNFESQIEKNQKKYSLTNEKESIKFFNFCKEIIKENPFEFIYINDNNLPITDKKQFPYKDRLDDYMELADIAVNLQPILLEKVNFNSVIFSSLIKEQHYDFYIDLCEKAVNKLPLTIKNIKIEYFPNQEKYINLWETSISKNVHLIKYLKNNNFIQENIYMNLFFRAYKKNNNVKIYFEDTKLPSNYKDKDDLFKKFDELINKSNISNYDFFNKK